MPGYGSNHASSDIVEITCLREYDVPTARSPPVRVTFEYMYQGENMLRKKSKVHKRERFAKRVC